jgi:CheY-like chemotaxis protein
LPENSQSVASKYVLVVDDSQPLRKLLMAQLAALGFTPLEAQSGEAALEVLASDACVDVLLTDVMMPGGVNGRELAQEAIALRPDIKVILTSGYPVPPPAPHSRHVTVPHLLRKPFGKNDLREALSAVLE